MVTRIKTSIDLKDDTINTEKIPFNDLYFIFGEKIIEIETADCSSKTITSLTRYKEHGPFTTQEAAQEYKDQHPSEEEGWEVKQVSYPTTDDKLRAIWVIRHDLCS
jgi:hypothetical protein